MQYVKPTYVRLCVKYEPTSLISSHNHTHIITSISSPHRQCYSRGRTMEIAITHLTHRHVTQGQGPGRVSSVCGGRL